MGTRLEIASLLLRTVVVVLQQHLEILRRVFGENLLHPTNYTYLDKPEDRLYNNERMMVRVTKTQKFSGTRVKTKNLDVQEC